MTRVFLAFLLSEASEASPSGASSPSGSSSASSSSNPSPSPSTVSSHSKTWHWSSGMVSMSSGGTSVVKQMLYASMMLGYSEAKSRHTMFSYRPGIGS